MLGVAHAPRSRGDLTPNPNNLSKVGAARLTDETERDVFEDSEWRSLHLRSL